MTYTKSENELNPADTLIEEMIDEMQGPEAALITAKYIDGLIGHIYSDREKFKDNLMTAFMIFRAGGLSNFNSHKAVCDMVKTLLDSRITKEGK